jgi:GT2 family glycosyltransferase
MLSVVIPSHSRADLLTLCLRSVTSYAPPGTEVLVVDDGSADGAISQTACAFGGVRAVRLPKRCGFCVAANAGIAAARGGVVELLNDDTEVAPGWADAAVRWFVDPHVAAVAPLVLQNDPTRRVRGLPPLIDSAGDEYDPGGFARKRGHNEPRGSSPPYAEPGPVWGASAAAAFYRRSAVLAAGGFPADFGAYFEDVDLAFRLRRLGFVAWFDPASVVWHRVSASYGRNPSRQVLERQSCNEERVFWRNIRGRKRVRMLPRHAAVLAGKAVRRLQEGTFVPWASGRVRAWAGG